MELRLEIQALTTNINLHFKTTSIKKLLLFYNKLFKNTDMKKILYATLLFSICLVVACSGAKKTAEATPTANPAKDIVDITAVVTGTGGNLGLYQFDGIGFKALQDLAPTRGDTFDFQLPRGEADIYYLGQANQQKKPIVVGPEPKIFLTGSARGIRQAVFVTSKLNKKYDQVIQQIALNKRDIQSIDRQMRQAGNNPELHEELRKRLVAIDARKKEQVTKLKTDYPFLAKIAALDNFQSFASDTKGYDNVLEHYVNEFFASADLADPSYNRITYIFEAFREYATTISGVGMPEEKVVEVFDAQLAKIPENANAYKYALGGIVLTLQQKNHPAFANYGSRFYEKYKSENQPHTLQLGRQIQSAKSLMIGAVAPDFAQNTPDGDALSLSDLRGKVILLDFWASWCGPCRKENPHVVKLYQKYKDQGFDVLGVSLDNSKAKWMGAIAKDQLTWHHVSDLKGWKNQAAASYSVRSIPATFLLDEKGQIIARNLRGQELDNQLKKIFGF